jgi:pseudaminic acid cytidylyltransferase
MNIAIIPARGGSKRIPNKNFRNFLGTPIIGRVIENLKSSDLFERIIVSTDSIEIATLAKEFGAEVPFIRPSELSDDLTGTSAVISHAVQALGTAVSATTNVCCVYPTAVLLTSEDLKQALCTLESGKWKFVFAGARFISSPLRGFVKYDSGGVGMIFPENQESRSQDLPDCFFDVGLFYWSRVENWLQESEIFCSESTFVEIPEVRAIDINTEKDWNHAELVYEFTQRL